MTRKEYYAVQYQDLNDPNFYECPHQHPTEEAAEKCQSKYRCHGAIDVRVIKVRETVYR